MEKHQKDNNKPKRNQDGVKLNERKKQQQQQSIQLNSRQ